MNSTTTTTQLSSCLYNASSCSFVNYKNECLSNATVLDTISKYVVPTYYEWICIVLYVIVFIVGTIGNLLVIIVIQRNRSMRTVTNMFIMNLAAADLLVLVFCLPATVIQDVTKTWFFGLFLCKFVNYIQNMSISVSVLTLMAISVERYQAIVHPLKFSGTKQRARILIISVWILSLLLVLPDAIMLTLVRHFGEGIDTIYLTYCQWNSEPLFDLIYQLHISLCIFIIPLGFMVFAYYGIAKVLWGSLPTERIVNDEKRTMSSSQNMLSGQADDSHGNGPNSCNSHLLTPTKSANLIVQENRQKAAKMLISVVIIFAICYIPVHVFNLFRYVHDYLIHIGAPRGSSNDTTTENTQCFKPKLIYLERTGAIKVVTISALVSHFLPYFNSSINPIIYNIMSDKFRIKFRELFSSCCCCCKQFVRTKSSSSTMIPFKASITIQHTTPTPSPTGSSKATRYHMNYTQQRTNSNSLRIASGMGYTSAVVNGNNNTRHAGINAYTPSEPTAYRLTNV